MAVQWIETKATAWAGLKFSLGESKDGAIAGSFEELGVVQAGSFGVTQEDGKTKEWNDWNGVLIDSIEQDGKIVVKVSVKNLNKSTTSKFWKIKDGAGGEYTVEGFSNSKRYSVKIESDVPGAEIVTIHSCKIKSKPVFSEDAGWVQELAITVLKGKTGYFTVSQVPAV